MRMKGLDGYRISNQISFKHKMAKHGMTFTNAYTNAANCQPGLIFKILLSAQRIVGPSKNSDITIADALKDVGYATGHFGKWHSKMAKAAADDVTYDSFGEGIFCPNV